MSLKIAIITESFLPVFNGVANSVVRVLETLKASGHEAIVIAPTTPGPTFLGFKTYKVPSVQLFEFQLGLPNLQVSRILDDFQPDVLHVASPVLLGSQAVNWAQRNQVPCVAIYQTDIAAYVERYGFGILRPMVNRVMASFHMPATINLAPTKEVQNYLTQLGVPNVQVWGRGVDLNLFHPNRKSTSRVETLREGFAPNGETIVGFVGRLAAEKQVDRFQELFDIPNTVFLIVGDGPERSNLEALFKSAKAKFVGKQLGENLADHYACMDVFVHFGTEETFGQTIQEAQASGLATVAPAAGGPKSLIESGVSGVLADPNAENGFSDIVRNLASDSNLRSRLAEGGRRAVLDKSWESNNAKLLEFYDQAIESNFASKANELLVA